jgi:hypothetical protein
MAKKTKTVTISTEAAKKLGELVEHFSKKADVAYVTRQEIVEQLINFAHANIVKK